MRLLCGWVMAKARKVLAETQAKKRKGKTWQFANRICPKLPAGFKEPFPAASSKRKKETAFSQGNPREPKKEGNEKSFLSGFPRTVMV
jgi:hypothetical protein